MGIVEVQRMRLGSLGGSQGYIPSCSVHLLSEHSQVGDMSPMARHSRHGLVRPYRLSIKRHARYPNNPLWIRAGWMLHTRLTSEKGDAFLPNLQHSLTKYTVKLYAWSGNSNHGLWYRYAYFHLWIVPRIEEEIFKGSYVD